MPNKITRLEADLTVTVSLKKLHFMIVFQTCITYIRYQEDNISIIRSLQYFCLESFTRSSFHFIKRADSREELSQFDFKPINQPICYSIGSKKLRTLR
jgi:hypothetical protein